MNSEEKIPTRKYPPIYEKMIPIMLVILGIIILGVLIATFGVVLGIVF